MAEVERRLIACDVGKRRRYTVIRQTRRGSRRAAREPPAGLKHAQSQTSNHRFSTSTDLMYCDVLHIGTRKADLL